jgi:TM2 domain-containing membrane protein YozV
MAYLLWFLSCFGIFGFHRWYLGKIPSAILWMCTGGLLGIGTIYDFFTLPSQVREANIRRAIFHGVDRGFGAYHRGWRNVADGEARIVNEKESVERSILRIAKENKGVLSASEVALSANISIEEAKRSLDALVSKGFAELRVRKSGALVYTIPDLMGRDDPLEDF